MTVFDYLIGMIVVGYNGKLKSKIDFKRIFKKGSAFLVKVAAQLDYALESNSVIRETTMFFFRDNGLLSFLENTGRIPNSTSFDNCS